LNMKNFILTIFVLYQYSLLAQNQLLIPDTISGSVINLEVKNGTMAFYKGASTQTMGINGPILAPTILLRKHQNVTLNVKNSLSDTTTIHWHGMHVAPQNDGGPHIQIMSGSTWSPSFEVLDNASTHWYHPHLHLKTHEQVQKGIAGFIIVRDSQEARLKLPRTYGVDDFPLAIQTKAFDVNNQIVVSQTAMDTALFVNATLNPYLDVPAQVIRFRLLNGSSERVFNLGFSDNRIFYQVGSDGGLLTAPVSMTRLLLSPGERAEILVNLSQDENATLQLMNYGSTIPNAHYGAAQPGMGQGQTQSIIGYTSNKLNGSNFVILKLNVKKATTSAINTIPTSLITHNPPKESEASTTRTLTFMSMVTGPGAINGPFVINNAHFDMDVINFKVPFNAIEIWELRNQTPIAHPFHIHNVHFYILSINGAAPPDHLKGKKDVVLVPAGNGTVRFIAHFTDFYNDTLPYMYHCHMLTHEDHGMMGQFVVNSPCQILKQQPVSNTAQLGQNAQFALSVDDTIGTTYQWQSNIGFGFQDLQNAGQYSGVNTKVLTIANVSAINENQQFRCKVANSKCSVLSDVVVLNIASLSVISKHLSNQIIINPHPFHSSFIFKDPAFDVNSSISIFTLQGKKVLNVSLYEVETKIDLSDFPAGTYILQYSNKSGTYNSKIVKY